MYLNVLKQRQSQNTRMQVYYAYRIIAIFNYILQLIGFIDK